MSASRRPRVDDDDLDDLDDVLEQFQPKNEAQKHQRNAQDSATVSDSNPSLSSADNMPAMDDVFMRELTQGMESLMHEIANEAGLNPIDVNVSRTGADGKALTGEEKQRQEALQAAWEKMLVEGMDSALNINDLSTAASKEEEASGAPPTEDSFEASIRKAMEKLKESDSSLKDGAASSVDDLMAQLGDSLDNLDPGEADEMQKVLENMMAELMSKEILYEPLKELQDKFPAYLKEHDATLSADDKKRYGAQQAVVSRILAIFEDPSYSDQNAEKSLQVVTLMNEMQSHGSPPSDIMAPLPPGLDFGADGMPKVPDGCVIA